MKLASVSPGCRNPPGGDLDGNPKGVVFSPTKNRGDYLKIQNSYHYTLPCEHCTQEQHVPKSKTATITEQSQELRQAKKKSQRDVQRLRDQFIGKVKGHTESKIKHTFSEICVSVCLNFHLDFTLLVSVEMESNFFLSTQNSDAIEVKILTSNAGMYSPFCDTLNPYKCLHLFSSSSCCPSSPVPSLLTHLHKCSVRNCHSPLSKGFDCYNVAIFYSVNFRTLSKLFL